MFDQADRIRQFALDHYVAPARANGLPQITIRAGDVHRAMGLANAMPAVCSAVGGGKFQALAGVTPVARTGPTNGANVYFRFNLRPGPAAIRPTVSPREVPPGRLPIAARRDLDLRGALVLVSCVKSKMSSSSQARSLYTSAWFTKARDIVEASGARWFVLSSLYGLVGPSTIIAPYDYTLNSLGVTERRAWARKVMDRLLPEALETRRVVMFAGQRYREFLIDPLRRRGVVVEIPMAHLTRGEQLAWLSQER